MQKRNCTTLALCLLLSFTATVTNAQVWEWTKPGPNGIQYTYPNVEDDAPYELASDAQGFVYALGDYNDSLFLNNNYITKGVWQLSCQI